jgi:hypothetical protein
VRRLAFVVALLLLGAAAPAIAQPWAPILDPTRATDWSYAGMTGGVPTTRTRCTTGTGTSLLASSSTAAQINTAIAGCDADHFVELGAGTFTLTAGVGFAGKNNVTLKGQGPDQTILKFSTGVNGCTAGNIAAHSGAICVAGTSGVWGGDVGTVTNIKDWTAGYAQGTTQITLNNTTSLTAGTIVVLDQCDETTDDGGVTNSAWGTSFMNESQTRGRHETTGCSQSGVPRSLEEFHKIVSVDNSTQITITPPVMMPTWRSGQSPQLWWLGTSSNTFITGSGVQGMTVDATSTSGDPNGVIMFANAYEGFVDNVRVIRFNRGGVSYRQAAKITVQNSYFYQANSFGAESYGNDILSASSLLIQNNIFQYIVAAVLGPAPGTVVAYNFALDFPQSGSNNTIGIFATHDAGGGVQLWEGNQTNGIISDFPHGQSPLQVMFRNHLRGVDEGEAPTGGNRLVFDFQSFSRGYSVVGNVLGLNSQTFRYECASGTGNCPGGTGDFNIYQIGFNRGGSTPDDAVVKASLLRWGNFDTVNDAVQFNSGEIPTSGIRSLNGNSVPSCSPSCLAQLTAIKSFVYSARPPWFVTAWGTPPWPPIGPEVTGGDHPDTGLGGRAYKIPARLCYENSAIDSTYSGITQRDRGFLLFNASACYTGVGLLPPTGLIISQAP